MEPAPAPLAPPEAPDQSENLANLKRFLSVNSHMCIPFISMTYFERIFLGFYCVIHILSFAYKYNRLPYPSYASVTELVMLSFFILSQLIKFSFATKGVNNRHPESIRAYILISVFIILTYIFFLRLQTYVTLLQIVLNSVGIGLTAIQAGVAIWLFIIFYRKRKII